ncbi:MAG TPA: electron transfer flavoprotein subunit beta [Geobacteraceae bacterium]
MPYKNLHILVLLREVSDPRPPARVITRGAAINDRGLRRVPNPADLSALEEALHLKELFGATVTALTVGPARLDDTLRLAVAMGADRVIRFWDHGLEGGDAVADSRILTRFIAILAPTLVFTGNRLADRGDDPVPALAAAAAGIPAVNAVLSLTMKGSGAECLRKSDRGARQTVAAPLPCTVLFEGTREPHYPSLDAVTRSLGAAIEEWELADLGLPFWEAGASGALLASAEFGVPRPDPVRVVTPDATLPAFERILSLLSGGIKAREGRLHILSAGETADGICRILAEEGLLGDKAL